MPPDDLLTTGEAARRLQVSLKTIRRWAQTDRLPVSWTPSGHRRFLASDVDAVLSDTKPERSPA